MKKTKPAHQPYVPRYRRDPINLGNTESPQPIQENQPDAITELPLEPATEEWEKWIDDSLEITEELKSLAIEEKTVKMTKGRGIKKFGSPTSLGEMEPLESNSAIRASSLTSNMSSSPRLKMEMGHVVEICGLPENIKTADIQKELARYESMFRIKWVDHECALIYFKTPALAQDLLTNFKTDMFRMCPFADASEASKILAQRESDRAAGIPTTTSSVPRPATTAVVARRMIANVLQIPELRSSKESGPDLRRSRNAETAPEPPPDYWDT
eukprot:TRINITY_DN11047_c0_g1_i1.p1 TRINITY_DN11047_c0_g1~~TRINITY_DN11047_c0_g1_i1.p1  ORF type:complete len:270 (-),score=44.98 TRINITY_DN11047_c0_g1_i1:63-872(-)